MPDLERAPARRFLFRYFCSSADMTCEEINANMLQLENLYNLAICCFPEIMVGGLAIAVICVTKNRTGDYDFRACARARGFRGSTFSAGHICFAVCAERSRDKTCVF